MAEKTVMTAVPDDGVSFFAHELRDALDAAEASVQNPAIFLHLEDGRHITGFRLVVDPSDGETTVYLTVG